MLAVKSAFVVQLWHKQGHGVAKEACHLPLLKHPVPRDSSNDDVFIIKLSVSSLRSHHYNHCGCFNVAAVMLPCRLLLLLSSQTCSGRDESAASGSWPSMV